MIIYNEYHLVNGRDIKMQVILLNSEAIRRQRDYAARVYGYFHGDDSLALEDFKAQLTEIGNVNLQNI